MVPDGNADSYQALSSKDDPWPLPTPPSSAAAGAALDFQLNLDAHSHSHSLSHSLSLSSHSHPLQRRPSVAVAAAAAAAAARYDLAPANVALSRSASVSSLHHRARNPSPALPVSAYREAFDSTPRSQSNDRNSTANARHRAAPASNPIAELPHDGDAIQNHQRRPRPQQQQQQHPPLPRRESLKPGHSQYWVCSAARFCRGGSHAEPSRHRQSPCLERIC
jgi:hypothetical protein